MASKNSASNPIPRNSGAHLFSSKTRKHSTLANRRSRSRVRSRKRSTVKNMDAEAGFFISPEDDLSLPPVKYEYLDHTADVQLHAWGESLKEAFEQCGMAMYGYMTELEYVQMREVHSIEANADDMLGLLYRFLDELLFLFCAEPNIICRKIHITEFNTEEFRIVCKCYGEEFQIGKHPQGTEVKAITYSAMQIVDEPKNNKFEVFVIIDI